MAKPAYKAEGMKKYLEEVSMAAFGRSRIKSIKADICVECGEPATEFNDNLSRKEYTISGMCQKCQDDIYG